MSNLEVILSILSDFTFDLEDEKQTQNQIETLFTRNLVPYKREYCLNAKNRIDFLSGNIGIEVKLKGRNSDVYNQIDRYLTFNELDSIILVTAKNFILPSTLYDKRIYYVDITKAWL